MLSSYIIVGIPLGLPLFLGLLFRVSTTHLFFSLMAGELLSRYFGHEVELIVAALVGSDNIAAFAEAAIVVVPVLLTAILLRGGVGKGKILLHFIPLLITGIVLAAFALPVLPEAVQQQAGMLPAGQHLLDASSLIIGLVVIVQLVALWLLNQPSARGKKN